MFFGTLIVILLMFRIVEKSHLLILLVFLFIISILSRKYRIPGVHWFMRHFERDAYIKRFPGRGIIFYLIGILLVLSFFSLDIALASIMVWLQAFTMV